MYDTEWPSWVMICCNNRKWAWRKGKWSKTRGSTAPIWNSNRGWRLHTWRRAVWWFKNWWRKAAGIWTNDSGRQGRNFTRFVVIACIGSVSQCCVQDVIYIWATFIPVLLCSVNSCSPLALHDWDANCKKNIFVQIHHCLPLETKAVNNTFL